MSSLVLELKSGDMMVINGAAIRFRTKTRLELASHARFLFGKQLMAPNEATTPARRIYYALQTAYIGNDEERPEALGAAQKLIVMFRAATTSPTARLILDEIADAAKQDLCYQALKLTRRIIRHEDAVLPPGAPSHPGSLSVRAETSAMAVATAAE